MVGGPEDLFRPTAAITSDGVPWLLFGRSVDAEVGVWAAGSRRPVGGAASRSATPAAPPSTRRSSRPTTAACTCAGRAAAATGSASSPGAGTARAWEETVRISDAASGNVWDPTLAVVGDGVAYAWTGYADGSYAIALRHVDARGAAGPVRLLTGGSDYALHPSLAATADGRLWCAFDVITVQGHGGSGPTRLRPRPTGGAPVDDQDGMREPGRSVPPELLPEVSAGIRVVCVEDGSTMGRWWSRPASWRGG